jgi:hypothetical protein
MHSPVASSSRIEVRLRELAQLFNSLDPSPFVDRDLDGAAEEFIVSWAREVPHGELELVIHVTEPPPAERAQGIQDAVQHYFADRAEFKYRELRQMLRRGRTSLVIGVAFLAVCFALSEAVQGLSLGVVSEFVEVGLQIVGWVAMWRPIEIYLYDWWPIKGEYRLLQRLARMKTTLVVAGPAGTAAKIV